MNDLQTVNQIITDYVFDVIDGNKENMSKFIPISLPRRFGKTTIVNKLKNERPYDRVKVVDNVDNISRDNFMRNILPLYSLPNTVLVVLFTPTTDDCYTTKLLKCGGFHVHLDVTNEDISVKYPDGQIELIPFLWVKKYKEMHKIMDILSEDLVEDITNT